MSEVAYKIIEGDQKTDDWQKLREGKLTGSVAKNVKTSGNAFLYNSLAMMTTERAQKEAYGEHIDRGNALEPDARKAYEKETKQKVNECAFIENGRLGISPDGFIYRKKGSCEIKKLLEIKCPDTPNHIKHILENRVPKEHLDQIIHGFVVVEDCDEIDFVSYDEKFHFKPLHIITVKRRDVMVDISATRIQYERFLEKLDEGYLKLIS